MKKISTTILICLTLLLTACSGTGVRKAGPNGAYANEDIYSGFEFKNNSAMSWFISKETKGTWTMENDEIHIAYEDGMEDTLTYDKENDSLSLNGIVEYKKVSDKEYNVLKEKGKSMQGAIDSMQSSKIYFDERPDIETPDSFNSSIQYVMKDGTNYFYSLGKDKNKASEAAAYYISYLESENYSAEDVTDLLGDEGVVAYSLNKNGKADGNLVYAYLQGEGYVIGISWN